MPSTLSIASHFAYAMADTTTIDTLIVVCCHAIWVGKSDSQASGEENVEDGWLIESFQKGESPTFVKHIQAGLEALRTNHNSILVFSGGQTKPKRTDLTEAGTYVEFVIANLPHEFHEHLHHIFVEGFATDSFQNILFSLLSYPKFVQECYNHSVGMLPVSTVVQPEIPLSPRHLIVVGHEFKRARFEELHLPALRYPTDSSRFTYIGIDPPFDEEKMQEIKDGDAKRGYGAWRADTYGTGALLAGKRVARGWSQDRMEDLTRSWAEQVKGQRNSNEETREQFEKVIAFVEGTEKHFPDRPPWS